jgi:hypothetical protein
MTVDIPYGKSFYRVAPDMRLLCEVEAELGSLPALHERFQTRRWQLSELVALIQILLQAGGFSADFMQLGDEILSCGTAVYLKIAVQVTRLAA